MNKKIILAIGFLILFAGGIFAWQYFGVPKEEIGAPKEEITIPKEVAPEEVGEVIKEETADWKIYRDEEYGFEIKYPENLNPEAKIDIPGDDKLSLRFGDGKIFTMHINITDPDMEGHMRLYTIEGTEKEILIDNIKGVQFYIADMAGEVPYIPYTLVKNKGRLYVFVGEGKTFGQMLSTFRFLE